MIPAIPGSPTGQPLWRGHGAMPPDQISKNVPCPEGANQDSYQTLVALSRLYARWENPVRAIAAVGGQFNKWPRLPYRVGELLLRIPEVPQQLSSLLEQFAGRRPYGSFETVRATLSRAKSRVS